jgi:hypothetical protein
VTVVISHATSRLTITADTTLAGGRRLTSDEMSHFRAMVTAIADRPELDRPEFIQQGSTEFDFTGGNVPTTKEGVLALFSSLSKSPCPSTGLQFALTDENIVVLD